MPRRLWQRLLHVVQRTYSGPSDDRETQLHERVLALSVGMMIPASMVWGSIYLWFGEPLAAAIPYAYGAFSFVGLLVFAITQQQQHFRFILFVQLVLSLLLPFSLHLALGGFMHGSAVSIWALASPLGALVFHGPRPAFRWFLAFVGLLLIGAALQPAIARENNLPPLLIAMLFAMNLLGVSAVIFITLQYFLGQRNTAMKLLAEERAKSDRLLLNVLPESIAAVLKERQQVIADNCDNVTVMFADIVGSTPLAGRLTPVQLVELLNEIFSEFDAVAARRGLEKIRTMGDAYLAAAGVPRAQPDHAYAVAAAALEIRDYLLERSHNNPEPLEFRIGIHSGPVVAGVIGHTKFHYDIWGDTVNVASRMESQGAPGQIQISQDTYELVKDRFHCAPRGAIEVRGKGMMQTWFLEGVREPMPSAEVQGGVSP